MTTGGAPPNSGEPEGGSGGVAAPRGQASGEPEAAIPPKKEGGSPSIDAKSAFAHLWQTPGGRGAIAIGGLMYLLFPLIIPPLIAQGWLIDYGRSVARADGELPRWRFGQAWGGLRIWFVAFVYALPAIAVTVAIYLPIVLEVIDAARTGGEPDPDTFTRFFSGQFALIGIVQLYSLALTLIRPAYNAVFINHDRVWGCFSPARLKEAIRPFGAGYLVAPLLVFAAGFIAGLGVFLCLIGIAFTIFYAGAVEFQLSGQLARVTRGEVTAPATT